MVTLTGEYAQSNKLCNKKVHTGSFYEISYIPMGSTHMSTGIIFYDCWTLLTLSSAVL